MYSHETVEGVITGGDFEERQLVVTTDTVPVIGYHRVLVVDEGKLNAFLQQVRRMSRSMQAHPDNQPDSEFEGCIDLLNESMDAVFPDQVLFPTS